MHFNQILYCQLPESKDEQEIVLRHAIERSVRRSPSLDSARVVDTGGGADLASFLKPDARVPIAGPIVEAALRTVSRNAPPRERARKIFDDLINTLVYDPRGCTPERAAELGDLAAACDLKRGTCTEFHGLFVARARALGIPARFAFGFNIPARPAGQVPGYHCWSEVFLPGPGWFAVDVTEAWKRDDPGERSFYFGNLDANRVQFTTGRDLCMVPSQTSGTVDTFIFPLAEMAGRREKVGLKFGFADMDT